MLLLPEIDLPSAIRAMGYLGIFGITFAESGLFFGFFLPGDSLLFTAGFLASQGYFHIGFLATGCFLMAVLGDSVGYFFGQFVGPKIFHRKDSFWFHKDHLTHAHSFYEKHGKKTIILARFMPIIRTFAPIVAGIGRMSYPTFLLYNFIGAGLWAVGMTVLGYFLGTIIPSADTYLLPIVGVIIFTSMLPSIIPFLKNRLKHRRSISPKS